MIQPPKWAIQAALRLRLSIKRFGDAIVPPEVTLFEITNGVAATQIAATIAGLGIADLLHENPMTSRQIADALGSDADTTHRMLRAAVYYGLCDMHPKTGLVSLGRIGQILRSDHPRSVREYAMYMGLPVTTSAWAGLTESVTSGKSAFSAVHGVSIWDWFSEHPAEGLVFARGMRRTTELSAATIATVYPWPTAGTVCDVAGGIGTLLSAIVRENPGLRGVLVDGPDVIAEAEQYLRERGVQDRITRVAGNIFERVDAIADVYLLKDILHDWDDEASLTILKTVAATMRSGTKLVLVEMLQDPRRPFLLAPAVDLQMLTQTDGGRQRSVQELSELLVAAGLRPTGAVRHAAPHDLVETEKP